MSEKGYSQDRRAAMKKMLLGAGAIAALATVGNFGSLKAASALTSQLTRSASSNSGGSGKSTYNGPYLSNISAAVKYLTGPFNPYANQYAQGTNTSGTIPIAFNWFANNLAANSSGPSQFYSIEPMESWKQAWCAIAFPQYVANGDTLQGFKVLQALQTLENNVSSGTTNLEAGWVHNFKDSPLCGVTVWYSYPNNNMAFAAASGAYTTTKFLQVKDSSGTLHDLGVFSAVPYQAPSAASYSSSYWKYSSRYNGPHLTSPPTGSFDWFMYTALNFYLRAADSNSLKYAMDNMNNVAKCVQKMPNGWVYIGTPGSNSGRGMYLGIFLYVCNVLGIYNTIALPAGITMADIETTLWTHLQSTSKRGAGAIAGAYSYSNGSVKIANYQNEDTSAAVLAYGTQQILQVQKMAAQNKSAGVNFSTAAQGWPPGTSFPVNIPNGSWP